MNAPHEQTPIKDALGDSYDNLTELQTALVDFADVMHQRFKKFEASDDIIELIESNKSESMSNFARMLSNIRQLMEAQDSEVYNDTAAADVANIALIVDLCQNKEFVA